MKIYDNCLHFRVEANWSWKRVAPAFQGKSRDVTGLVARGYLQSIASQDQPAGKNIMLTVTNDLATIS